LQCQLNTFIPDLTLVRYGGGSHYIILEIQLELAIVPEKLAN